MLGPRLVKRLAVTATSEVVYTVVVLARWRRLLRVGHGGLPPFYELVPIQANSRNLSRFRRDEPLVIAQVHPREHKEPTCAPIIVHVAGDFVDLHSLPLKPMDHGITRSASVTSSTFHAPIWCASPNSSRISAVCSEC